MPLYGARAGPGVCVPRSSHFISRKVVRQQRGSGSNTSSSSSSIRGHYKMSSLKRNRTEKEKLSATAEYRTFCLPVSILIKGTQVPFTNDPNLGQVCIRPDEMISDTFIINSFLQSIHYHYRQPVWFKKSALKSIKPHWTSWEEKMSKRSAFICGKELSGYLDKWLSSSLG